MTSPATVSLRIPQLKQPLKLHVHDDRDRYISRRLREEGVWEPFETSLLLASLHAGIVSPAEAERDLLCVAQHLHERAEALAARATRWLPMLVALSVGFLTILTYVFLIYLPWILLLQRVVEPAP